MKFSSNDGSEITATVTREEFIQPAMEAIAACRKAGGKWPFALELSYPELDLIVKSRQYHDIVRYCDLPRDPDPLEVLGYVFAIRTVAVRYESAVDPVLLRTIGQRLIEVADALKKP